MHRVHALPNVWVGLHQSIIVKAAPVLNYISVMSWIFIPEIITEYLALRLFFPWWEYEQYVLSLHWSLIRRFILSPFLCHFWCMQYVILTSRLYNLVFWLRTPKNCTSHPFFIIVPWVHVSDSREFIMFPECS